MLLNTINDAIQEYWLFYLNNNNNYSNYFLVTFQREKLFASCSIISSLKRDLFSLTTEKLSHIKKNRVLNMIF